MSIELIKQEIEASINVKNKLLLDVELMNQILDTARNALNL